MHIFLFFFLACNSDDKGATDSNGDPDSDDKPADPPILQWELAFEIAERPYALAAHPDSGIYCSGQSGENIYTWDGTGAPIRLAGSFDDVHGVAFDGDTLYYTTSDFGVTGTLMRYDDGDSTLLASQASDGTLFRWPMDLSQSSNGEWLLADYNVGAIFSVATDGSSLVHSAGSATPEVLAWKDSTLYVGGEDGVWKIDWPNGTPQQVDERAAYGLINLDNTIFAVNSTDGIFAMEGEAAPIDEIARPGKMLHFENMLYVADHVGQGVWVAAIQEE